jgi:hypothetical protein
MSSKHMQGCSVELMGQSSCEVESSVELMGRAAARLRALGVTCASVNASRGVVG